MNPIMALDRIISLYAVKPLFRILPIRKKPLFVILMYHSISNQDEGAVHPYYRLCTPPKLFDAQLTLIKELGYSVLPLGQAVEQFTAGTLAGKNAVITFDDGFKDFYSNGFPLLNRHGFTATVFLPVDFISHPGPHLGGREHLSWTEVLELSAKWVSFGSHTLTHRQLYSLSQDEMETELRRSKKTIESHLGLSVDSFSYPYAFPENRKAFIATLKACLQQCGYRLGVTTKIGTVTRDSDVFFLPRIPVNAGDDRLFFKAKIEGHYDWIHSFQILSKRFRKKLFS
jgi:peptidoglycan/xylan/chitin deacetylase (PgdA/CDA1 family)